MKEEFKSMDKLYHYTTFETALKILDSKHLRFGRLSNMNDIHENDKITFVDVNGNPIDKLNYEIIGIFDNELATIVKSVLLLTTMEKKALALTYIKCGDYMQKKAKAFA